MASKAGFLVSGSDTGVGKTTVGCGLATGLRDLGVRVGVMKPVETGCESVGGEMIALDAIALQAAASSSDPLDQICPYRYTAPLAPAAAADQEGRAAPDLRRIRTNYDQLAASSDLMLVESAGGIAVPITWRENYADLALALDLGLILVVNNRLGSLNGALLSLDYAARRGVRIKGYVLNDAAGDLSLAAQTNAGSLRRLTKVPCLGAVRYREQVPVELCRRVLAPD